MLSSMSLQVIINAGSGAFRNEELRSRLSEIFGAAGADTKIMVASDGKHLLKLIKLAIDGDGEIVVAGGGDGTVSTVASAVLAANKTLGVLPLGTLNHFAKDLRIPLDLEAAAQNIIAGHTVNIDVGEVNGHIFLNNSSLGLYPSIVQERKKKQRLGKWPAFVWACVTVLRRYPFLHVRLKVDQQEYDCRTPFVFIGNNEYEMESFQVGARARLDGAQLSLYMTRGIGRLGLVRLGLRALFGGLRREKDFMALATNKVVVESRHKVLRVAMDGEVMVMPPPLRYLIRPAALRVIVPGPQHY